MAPAETVARVLVVLVRVELLSELADDPVQYMLVAEDVVA